MSEDCHRLSQGSQLQARHTQIFLAIPRWARLPPDSFQLVTVLLSVVPGNGQSSPDEV